MIKLFHGDCLDIMKDIQDKSVNLILCDLPYGTTSCKWDTIIPLKPLWEQYERIIADDGAIVLFGQEPFSSLLRTSNLKLYKYDWVWRKTKVGGFMNSKNAPLKEYENIMVFSKGTIANGSPKRMKYNPQGLKQVNLEKKNSKRDSTHTVGNRKSREVGKKYIQEFTNYPKNILSFESVKKPIHPTEKPVKLLEYLIKTYSDQGDIVLDNCMGSGSTKVASINTNRYFIGIEKEEKYFNLAKKRI